MKKPEKAKIFWLVKIKQNQKIVLGLLRDKYDGCFIIGGPTGSHYTGHGESWKSKWKEYLNKGYIDVDLAKKNQLLPLNWFPPKITQKDQSIINIITEK